MIITKEKIQKDVKKGFIVLLVFTIGMILPSIFPIFTVNDILNKIITIVFLFMIFTLPFGIVVGLRFLIEKIYLINKIKNNNIYILEDTISDIYIYQNTDFSDYEGQIILEKYSLICQERLKLTTVEKKKVKKGDTCFLIFTDLKKEPILSYNGNEYKLEESLKDRIISINEIKNARIQNNQIDEIITLTKKKLLKDCVSKDHIKTIIINFLFFIISICVFVFSLQNSLIATIVTSFVVIFLLFMIIIKIYYIIDISQKIKNNKYKLVQDVVIEKAYSKQYNSNFVKFKKNKNNVYYDSDDILFAYSNVDDIYYMLFAQGESDPLKIYNSKNIMISDEVEANTIKL